MTHYAEGEPYGGNNLPPSTPYVEKSPGRTRQDDKEQTDINVIMAKFQKTGMLPVKNREVFFADVSTMGSYHEAVERIRLGEEGFMNLPPNLRSRFENDPAKFLDFTSDPDNREELVELGILEGVDFDTEVEAASGVADVPTPAGSEASSEGEAPVA